MIVQEQLGKPQQLTGAPLLQSSSSLSVLGNQFAQAPTVRGEANAMVEAYRKLVSTAQPAFRLALVKQRKFTSEGRVERIAASLAAVNAAQPTELTPAQWKEIVEEIDEED
jgi:flavorubredoxin